MSRHFAARLIATALAAAILAALTTQGVAAGQPDPAGARSVSPLQVEGPITVGGALSDIERDAGISAPLSDGSRIWAFGDSYGGGFHTSTAAFTSGAAPNTMIEPFDANSNRYEFIPHTADEMAFNQGLGFHAVEPTRLADTRDASGDLWPAPRPAGPLVAGGALWLDIDAHPALGGLIGGGAAVLNITGVNTTGASTFTHLAVGQPFTTFTTSTLNLAPGEVAANLTALQLGLGGLIGIATAAGTTDVIVDLHGWFDASHTIGEPTPAGEGFNLIAPTRILDTASGSGGPLLAGSPRTVQVTGSAVPPGATAVAVNLTADLPTADTHLTAWPAGLSAPPTSNLNLAAGTTRANMAIVPLGTAGQLMLSSASGSTRAIIDVVGWFGPGATGDELVPVNPIRLLDTRESGLALTAAGRTISLPAEHVPEGAGAAVVNLTAVSSTADTHLTAWQAGAPQPPTSNLNLPAGATRPSLAIVPLDASGRLRIRTNSGSVHVVVDLLGVLGNGGAVVDPCPPRSPLDPRPYLALWPQSVVSVPQPGLGDAVFVYFISETVCTAINYVHGDAGIARYDYRPQVAPPGSEPIQATRLADHLFAVSESYKFGRGGIRDGSSISVFGCDPDNDLVCRRTTAAIGDDLASRESYVDDATDLDLPPNLAALNPPADLSVEWVPALGLYAMLYIPPPWPADTALLRTADDLSGPWSDPITLTLPGCGPGDNGCYTPRIRPDLTTPSSLAITYFDKDFTDDALFDGRLLHATVPISLNPP